MKRSRWGAGVDEGAAGAGGTPGRARCVRKRVHSFAWASLAMMCRNGRTARTVPYRTGDDSVVLSVRKFDDIGGGVRTSVG